mgnify:CR=1 FL=1
MRRSISDIVAVVLLIVIAIAAAVIIYMWLSGLIGAVHSTSPALGQKVEIVGASVSSSGKVQADVMVPQDSSSVTIAALEVQSTNGTTLCTASSLSVTYSNGTSAAAASAPISPGTTATVQGSCTSGIPSVGTPVEVVVVTTSGVTASYQTTVS